VLPQCLAAIFQAAAQGADAAGQREPDSTKDLLSDNY